jgi:hypothetical protein
VFQNPQILRRGGRGGSAVSGGKGVKFVDPFFMDIFFHKKKIVVKKRLLMSSIICILLPLSPIMI